MKPYQQDISLLDTSLDILDRVSTYVHKSVVFADDKFAEILHWHGGASMLLDFGVTSIKEFSSFENGELSDNRATFFLSSPLTGITMETLKDVIAYSSFKHMTVITNVHPVMEAVINFRQPDGDSADDVTLSMKRRIVLMMREKMDDAETPCTCDIIYIPLVACSILPNLFSMPAHCSLFPLLPTDIHLLMTRHKLTSQSELSFEHMPKQLQLKYKLLVSSLNSLLELLNVSEDVFAMGTTSDIVAGELASLPWSRNRRKSSNRKASLVLVDRTLDVGNVSHRSFESTLDKILNALPRLPGHDVDVCVDMSLVCNVASNKDFACAAPGCLAHPGPHKYSTLLNTLALLKHKEITTELIRRLVEALEREGLHKKTNQSGVLDVIQHYVGLFKNQPIAMKKHSPLLQLALAVVQSQRSTDPTHIEQLVTIEKMILQGFHEDEDDLGSDNNMVLKVVNEFKKSFNAGDGDDDDHGRLEDLLSLLLYLFSLDEQRRWSLLSKEETLLEKELVDAFMRAKRLGNSPAAKLVEVCRTEMECLSVVQDLIDRLKGLSSAKSCLQKYRHAMDQGTVTSPACHRPIIKQLIQDILDPIKPDLVDVNHKSTTFGDLIKTGFGFFRGSSKARPGDHPLLVVFVIGGVNMSEVKQVRDVLATRNQSQTQVLIGGTSIVTPNDVLNLALLQDNLCD